MSRERKENERQKLTEPQQATEPKQATEAKHQTEDRHSFRPGLDVMQTVGRAGEATAVLIRDEVEGADEDYRAGAHELNKYGKPLLDMAALASAREASKEIGVELNQTAIAGKRVQELIQSGKLSMVELGDRKLLKERMETLPELTEYQKQRIKKFRQPVYDMLLIKDAIKRKQKLMQEMEAPLRNYLDSADYFDLGQEKTNELLKRYFHSSGNEVLRKVKPTSLKSRDVQRLMKTQERNGFSDIDMAALRLAGKQTKFRESRIHVTQLLNVQGRIERMGRYGQQADDTAGAGLRQMAQGLQIGHTALTAGKLGMKAGVVTASTIGRYTGISRMLHTAQHKSRAAVGRWKSYAAETIKASSPYQRAAKVKETVSQRIEQNSSVQRYRRMQQTAKNRAAQAGRRLNQTKAAARNAGRTAAQAKDILVSPVRLVGKGMFGIGKMWRTGTLILAVALVLLILFFVMIVLTTNAVLSIFQTQMGSVTAAILTEDEAYVAEVSNQLQELKKERLEEAVELAESTPINPYVHAGHTISKYGHPGAGGTWTNGTEILYLNGFGEEVSEDVFNIRDCIVMAYVIMDGAFDENEAARDQLISDLWMLLNPQIISRESDIYICPSGCDSFSYSCDSSWDYSRMSSFQNSGVAFYGHIEGYGEYGDVYYVHCKGCKSADKKTTIYHEVQTGSGQAIPADGCVNHIIQYSCWGHSVPICFGHKDMEVQVMTQTMEELFVTGQLPAGAGTAYESYLHAFAGWTEENKEWARNLRDSDWLTLYGVNGGVS